MAPGSTAEPLTEDSFRQLYSFKPPERTPISQKVKKAVACQPSVVKKVFPILEWLPRYSFRNDLLGDIVAGITVAIMHIPHGLAYAPLAGQAPVVGLYMAVFPAIIYLFLGTSRHISLGTFAVVCMMIGRTVSNFENDDISNGGSNGTIINPSGYTNLQVGVTIGFLVGAIEFTMGILNLGFLWLLLSSSTISGFTTGSAVHVTVYQIKNLLGVPGARFNGPLKLIYTLIDLGKNVPKTNLVTLGISICSIFILSIFNELIKPRMQKRFPKLKIPIPIELIVILLGIGVSYGLNLEEEYDVLIVKTVPTGFPSLVMPEFELMPQIIVDCFVIAVVAISMSLSLADIFARKLDYEIRRSQELVAYGSASMFASFFQCVPCAASLSRSLVQATVGGKTQLASVFTMGTIVVILLFLGHFFEPVPYCVLSSVVVVTLKGLVWQAKDLPSIWRRSNLDGIVWIVTFGSVLLLDLDYGLLIGLIISVLVLIQRGQRPEVVQLGRLPGSGLLVDKDAYPSAETFQNVLMVKVSGTLHFANYPFFHDQLSKLYKQFLLANILRSDKTVLYVILDLSCVPNVDPTAASGLVTIFKDFKTDNCQLILSDCNSKVYEALERCKCFEVIPKDNVMFSTLDCVEYYTSGKVGAGKDS